MAQRIKGQEVEVIVIAGGQTVVSVSAIRSFEFNYNLDTLSEGYIGETTERKDSIYKGISGKLEFHFDSQDVLKLAEAIRDKARRRTPGLTINIKATLNFPGGNRPRVVIPNVEFGAIPVTFGSRADYGSMSLDYVAQDANVIYS